MRSSNLMVTIVMCVSIGGSARAKSQLPARIPLSGGRTLEVIGLRRWTLPMMEDSLAWYAPGNSLESHACAAALRYTLGFADASSTQHVSEGEPTRIVVTVREPQDSARVHFRVARLDTVGGRADWRVAREVMQRRPDVFWPVAQAFLHGRTIDAASRVAADSALWEEFARFLLQRTSPADFKTARRVLDTSPNMYDRGVAALILANFPDRDEAWWALAQAMRETDGPVKGTAGQALVAMSRRHPRRVAWAAVAPGIHAMLDGTSLFELPGLLEVLVRTQAKPSDAVPFLRGGGDMVVRYLDSSETSLVRGAHTLLLQLRGRDLGTDSQAWRAWIATL